MPRTIMSSALGSYAPQDRAKVQTGRTERQRVWRVRMNDGPYLWAVSVPRRGWASRMAGRVRRHARALASEIDTLDVVDSCKVSPSSRP